MNHQNSVNSGNEKKYFDIITTGLGYINDVRIVDPKNFGGKGAPYLAVRIVALHGEVNQVNYIGYNANVVGSAAIDIIQQEILPALQTAEKNGREVRDVKVIASFSVGDAEPKLFHYTKDYANGKKKKGDIGVTMQGRLLAIKHLKIDGQEIDLSVYNDDDTSSNNDDATESSNAASSSDNTSS